MNYPDLAQDILEEFTSFGPVPFRFDPGSGMHVHAPAKSSEYVALWRARNPLKVREQQRRHAPVKAISTKAWKAANRERVNEHNRRYKEKKRAERAAMKGAK